MADRRGILVWPRKRPTPENPELKLMQALRQLEDDLTANWNRYTPDQRRVCIKQMAEVQYQLRYGGLKYAS